VDQAVPRDASLVLVRHGRTTWVEERRFQGSADVPLSAHGNAQASALAARLADQHAAPGLPLPEGPPRAIRHSPLARAADTASAIARARDATHALVADADLREIAQGEWEGLRHVEVMAGWPQELARWREDPLGQHAPGGESLDDAARRAGRAVERMLADVGSGLRPATADDGSPAAPAAEPPAPGTAPHVNEHDPWSITVAHDGILRLVMLRLLDLPLERYWSFPFALCGITVVEVRSGRARVRAHNIETHLGELAG
jgi:broad specificity phosphatase PhoE